MKNQYGKDKTLSRFQKKVRVTEAGCWIWQGSISVHGYGKFRAFGKDTSAHRYAYTVFKGEIPNGLQIDHLCRVRACCNPDHLEAVTCQENLLRGQTFQSRNSKKTHCPAGHEYTEQNTYRYPDGRRRCIACRRIADMADKPRERRKEYKKRLRESARKPLSDLDSVLVNDAEAA